MTSFSRTMVLYFDNFTYANQNLLLASDPGEKHLAVYVDDCEFSAANSWSSPFWQIWWPRGQISSLDWSCMRVSSPNASKNVFLNSIVNTHHDWFYNVQLRLQVDWIRFDWIALITCTFQHYYWTNTKCVSANALSKVISNWNTHGRIAFMTADY
jgi:hypothetical protein